MPSLELLDRRPSLAKSGRLVLPMMTAPAALRRATTLLSVPGMMSMPCGGCRPGVAVGRRLAGVVHVVLHDDRHAVQRPQRRAVGPPGVGRGGLGGGVGLNEMNALYVARTASIRSKKLLVSVCEVNVPAVKPAWMSATVSSARDGRLATTGSPLPRSWRRRRRTGRGA
jgi:hypothetical protein